MNILDFESFILNEAVDASPASMEPREFIQEVINFCKNNNYNIYTFSPESFANTEGPVPSNKPDKFAVVDVIVDKPTSMSGTLSIRHTKEDEEMLLVFQMPKGQEKYNCFCLVHAQKDNFTNKKAQERYGGITRKYYDISKQNLEGVKENITLFDKK